MSNNIILSRLFNILSDIKTRINTAINSKVDTTVYNQHKQDSSHITNTERNTWNSKADGSHTHTMADISDMPSSISNVASELNAINSTLTDHGTRLTTIEDDIDNLTGTTNELSASISDNATEITNLADQVNTNSSNISENADSISRLQSTTEAALNDKTSKAYVDDAITNVTNTLSTHIDDTTVHLTTNDRNILLDALSATDASNTYATIQDLNTANDNISTLQSDMDNISSRFPNLIEMSDVDVDNAMSALLSGTSSVSLATSEETGNIQTLETSNIASINSTIEEDADEGTDINSITTAETADTYDTI